MRDSNNWPLRWWDLVNWRTISLSLAIWSKVFLGKSLYHPPSRVLDLARVRRATNVSGEDAGDPSFALITPRIISANMSSPAQTSASMETGEFARIAVMPFAYFCSLAARGFYATPT